MEKDKGENDNVVRMRIVRDSYHLPDGGVYLTDKLDPVLFAEYLKQKKMFDEAIVFNGQWKTQYEAMQKKMEQWRLAAYIGIGGMLGVSFMLKIVSEYAKIKGG